jgi:D-alanine-D-alanine ligase
MRHKKKKGILIIFGGQSAEHEVSLQSAQSVILGFNPKKYNIFPLAIDKKGKWLNHKKSINLLLKNFTGEKKDLIKRIIAKRNVKKKVDIIFPVLHGPYGEDGTIQGLSEMIGLPYIGADVYGSVLGMDKIVQKKIFETEKIEILPWLSIRRNEFGKETIKNIIDKFDWPVFVKPACLGSSIGISKVGNNEKLKRAIQKAFLYGERILIEQGIEAKEVECSVLGNNDPKVSLPGEIITSREFYSYKAKYLDKGRKASQLIIPAQLSDKTVKKIQKIAIKTFKILELSGMARIDFLVEKGTGKIYLNEPNTIPGFTKISMYPKLWEASGLKYEDLLDELVNLAEERFNKKHQQRRQKKNFMLCDLKGNSFF